MNEEELQAIRKRLSKATLGPWYVVHGDTYQANSLCGDFGLCGDFDREDARWTVSAVHDIAGWETDGGYSGYGIPKENAEFIAHAREDIPKLLDEIERLKNKKTPTP